MEHLKTALFLNVYVDVVKLCFFAAYTCTIWVIVHSTPQKYLDWFSARIQDRLNPCRVFYPPAACLWK